MTWRRPGGDWGFCWSSLVVTPRYLYHIIEKLHLPLLYLTTHCPPPLLKSCDWRVPNYLPCCHSLLLLLSPSLSPSFSLSLSRPLILMPHLSQPILFLFPEGCSFGLVRSYADCRIPGRHRPPPLIPARMRLCPPTELCWVSPVHLGTSVGLT